MEPVLSERIYSLKRSDIRVFSALAAKTPGCISLTLGEPDFDTPEVIVREVRTALENHETHYIANSGSAPLRKKIAWFENSHHGRSYTSANVIVTAGAEEGLFLSLFGILNPGDEAVIPVPAYPAYEEIVKAAGGKPVHLDTAEDHFQINKDKLSGLVNEHTRAVILNTPNNPTGTALSEESLQIVHDVVQGRNLFVICDDVYQQLVYEDSVKSFMDFSDLKEQQILVQSFSKPYAMTGWRMGYLCAGERVIERLELLHQFMITSTPSLFQRSAEKALSFDPSCFLDVYRKRRNYVLDRLEKMGLPVTKPEGAFYVFPSIAKYGLSSDEFCRRMIREAGLAAIPGSAFGSEGYIRLSYCYGGDVLKEGMDRLEEFLYMLEGKDDGLVS